MRSVEEVFAPLFAVQPFSSSFTHLVQPSQPVSGMEYAVRNTLGAVQGDACLISAIHLYADDLDRAHTAVADIENDHEAAYWHGIMHRREGDFSNANYWFRRTGTLRAQVGHDPVALTERAEAAHRAGTPPPESLLLDIRKEFRNLAQIGIDRMLKE